MSLDMLKQNIRTIIEVADFYNELIKGKNKVGKKKAKLIDLKIENATNYILKLSENIRKLAAKEKEELQKNA